MAKKANAPEQPSARKTVKSKIMAKASKTKPKKKQTQQQRTKAGKARMIKAMEAHHAIVTDACKAAKIGRTQHYKWLEDDPAYVVKIIDTGEQANDYCEGQLLKRIAGYQHPDVHVSNYKGEVIITPIIKHYPPDTHAILGRLKATAKDRGYFDKVENSVRFPEGGIVPLTLNIQD